MKTGGGKMTVLDGMRQHGMMDIPPKSHGLTKNGTGLVGEIGM